MFLSSFFYLSNLQPQKIEFQHLLNSNPNFQWYQAGFSHLEFRSETLGPAFNEARGERAPHSTLPEIERKKFLVPSTMQCYEYLGAKNQCDLKIIQLPLTRIKWKLLRCINICIYIYTNARVWQTSICDDLPLLYTTIYTILIYSSIKICSSCIASIQSNNQLYRSSLPSPHVFPIARSPELIVVIPKTSNTSCSVRETFDILFIGDMNFIAVGPEQHGQGQGVPV